MEEARDYDAELDAIRSELAGDAPYGHGGDGMAGSAVEEIAEMHSAAAESAGGLNADADGSQNAQPGAQSAVPPELPELPVHNAGAQSAMPQRDAFVDGAMAMLGCGSREELGAALEQIAVDRLTGEGVPEQYAREIVAMRRGGLARDEPGTAGDLNVGAAGMPNAGGLGMGSASGGAGGGYGAGAAAQPTQVSPAIAALAQQAQDILDATGVNMVDIMRANGDIMAQVAEYDRTGGRGGLDMRGAYDVYRRKVMSARPRLPPNGESLHGGTPTLDITKLTDAQMDDYIRRAGEGEEITFR